jgi:hypothetical protein
MAVITARSDPLYRLTEEDKARLRKYRVRHPAVRLTDSST